MLNSVLVRSIRKIDLKLLNDLYENNIKLKWIANARLLAWFLIIISIILY
jgi:hypothetical protein